MNTFARALLFSVLLASPALAENAPKAPAPVPPPAPAAPAISAEERLKIELVVKDLLMREPQLVMDAAQAFQAKEREAELAKAGEAIKTSGKELYEAAHSPVSGNPKGDVTIVEFFDYNCGYCKRAHPTTKQLLVDDKNIRYVYEQFPILGPTSGTAAQAAMAAHKQGKYVEMHEALMTNKEPLSDAVIEKIAGGIKGLDVAKLKTDMNSDAIKKDIGADLALGQKLGVQGTPGFVIADQLYPGAMDADMFKKFVAAARAKAPAKQ